MDESKSLDGRTEVSESTSAAASVPSTVPPATQPPAPQGVPRWPAIVALLVIGVLLSFVSDQLTIGPSWLPLAIILVLMIPLTIATLLERHDWRRVLVFIGLVTSTVGVASSTILLIRQLLEGETNGSYLLTGSGAIWVANLLTFALWYWEIDGGGPSERRMDGHVSTDFLFPQLQIGDGTSSGGWTPLFLDYLFVAFTASTAFSPTDTLILSRRVKVLMMIQALTSLVTVGVIAARAINILR
jgi:hypothetical protein